VTDEPKNPIDEPSETPEALGADAGVGQAETVPSSVPASGADAPAEPDTPTQPLAEPEAQEVRPEPEATETPGEAEAAETPVEAKAAQTPVEAPSSEDSVTAAPSEESTEGEGEKEEEEEEEEKSDKMDWYILKVQSNREESIREGLLRRVAIAGLEKYFGDIIVPVEQVTEFKAGKKRVTKRKLYPGYLVVEMEINDDTWFLVRETPGIGDFTGAAGHPTPMLPHEVSRILARQEERTDEAPKLKIAFTAGDHVKINDGTFENFEGEVYTVDETNGRVTVMINIFGRSTPVELEYWQIESV